MVVTSSCCGLPPENPQRPSSSFKAFFLPAGLKKSSRVKKKPVAQAAKTTDKEHVNVVFIGHVDAGRFVISTLTLFPQNSIFTTRKVNHWRTDHVPDQHGGQEDTGEV